MTGPVVPTRDDPGVAELSEVLGGPGGAHARVRGWAPLAAGLLVAALLVLAGAGLRAGCTTPAWGADSTQLGPGCFSALPGAYVAGGGAERTWPYGEGVGDPVAARSASDPVARYAAGPDHALVGATMLRAALADVVAPDDVAGRASEPVEDLYRDDAVQAEAADTILVAAGVVGAAALALVLVVARFRAGRTVAGRPVAGRPWDGVLLAASPLLALAALVDVSLVGVALAAAGVLAVRRHQPLLAGALLGLGLGFAWVAWAVLLGLVAALVGAVATRRVPALSLGAFGAATVGGWVVVSLPAIVTGPGVWAAGWTAALDGAGAPGSLRAVAETLRGGAVPAYPLVALVVLLIWAATLAVVLVARRGAARPPRVEQVVLAVVAVAVALLGAGPADALAVLPFAVLALPRLWPLLGWQLVELAHAAVLWWTTTGALVRGETVVEGPLAAMTLLRVVALLLLAGVVVRAAAMPSQDPLGAERARGQEISTRSNVVAV